MVGSQIGSLTFGPSLGHNLCFKNPNVSYEPILNIYVSKVFPWYNEFFDPMSFDPWMRSLKIWKSTGTLTPKVGMHLGVCGFIPSHFLPLSGEWNVTHGLHFQLPPLQALTLVANSRLRSRQKKFFIFFTSTWNLLKSNNSLVTISFAISTLLLIIWKIFNP